MRRWLGRRRRARLAHVARRGERGETLIELLLSVAIVAITVVAVIGALATAIAVSALHRQQATAAAAVRDFAEALQLRATRRAAAPGTAAGYVECAGAGAYDGAYTAPDGYTATVTTIQFWSGGATPPGFVGGCPGGHDEGVQMISIEVSSDDGRAVETLDVVLRKPCGTGDTCGL